jgi:hypothetical protein
LSVRPPSADLVGSSSGTVGSTHRIFNAQFPWNGRFGNQEVIGGRPPMSPSGDGASCHWFFSWAKARAMQRYIDRSGIANRSTVAPFNGPQLGLGSAKSVR